MLPLALVLGGCSAVRLGYTQGPMLGGWWLDGYFDFNATQKPVVQQGLAEWFDWHRSTQLPVYADELARLRAALGQPSLSAAQVCEWPQRAEAWLQAGLEQALPVMARVAPTLSPAQLRHFQHKLDERNDTFLREEVQADEAERRDKRLAGWRKRYEDLYGALTPPQLRLLEEAAGRIAPDPKRREAEHLARQRELLAVLAGRPATPEAVQQALAAPLRPGLVWDGWGSAAWQAERRQQRQAHCELFARLHQQSTPAQREHAQRWLGGWEQDMRRLAATGAAPLRAAAR